MSMRVKILDTGVVADYDDSYALRLIEQGDAILVSGDTPVTPEPEPIDPSEYSDLIQQLQETVANLQTQINDLSDATNSIDNIVFADMFQSITQAKERQLEYLEEEIEEELNELIEGED